MKKKTLVPKLLRGISLLFVLLLWLAIVAKYLSGASFAFLAVLSLMVPLLVGVNLLFMIFYVFKKRRFALEPAVTLILGFFLFGPFYKINSANKGVVESDITVMTFNVRGFNKNKELALPNADSLIVAFIEKNDPDILCLQEAHRTLKTNDVLSKYPHKFIDYNNGERSGSVILGLYSKYPLLQVKVIDFSESSNKAMYADILIDNDTIRMFNLHLQSFRIVPNIDLIQKEDSEILFGRMGRVFKRQQKQAEMVRSYLDSTKMPKVVVGDFNNTQFSSIYHTIRGEMSDTFLKSGRGFGSTYNLNNYPMRIDYILADQSFEIRTHDNFDVELSDHYPVLATLRLKSAQ